MIDFVEQLVHAGVILGQVITGQTENGHFTVRHVRDARTDPNRLFRFRRPTDAREIARFDEDGKYRPLKGAPNLRAGWELFLSSCSEIYEALNYLYPGAIATFANYQNGRVTPVDLRSTLNRQSGMYRVAQKLKTEEGQGLISLFCCSNGKCLRTILWTFDGSRPPLDPTKFDPAFDQSGAGQTVVPFLCVEACNLLVAAARKAVKSRSP